MVSDLLFLLGVGLVIFPGICGWTLLFPKDSMEQRLAWGSVLGLGAAVYLAYVCAFGHLSWFYVVWSVLLAISIGSCVWWYRQRCLSLSDLTGIAFGSTSSAGLVLLLLLTVGLQTYSVQQQSVPPGFDPAFHLLLAKKIALSDHIIRDWQPFDDAALNYPLGSHFLIVLFGRFSGLLLPRVFQLLMVTFSALSTLAVYTLAAEYFASETVGLYSAIAYGLWAFVGSADYLRWGGLPNQLGMLLGLGIVSLVIRVGEERKRIVLMALLFASVCLTHHHVMLSMGSVLFALMLFFLATNDPERRYRTIFFALAMASVAASFFLIPYALKALSLRQTNVFHMDDAWPVLGVVLVCFAMDGAALDYRREGARSYVFHFVSATLLVLYVLFGWVYYYYRVDVTGEGASAFTPSRFITDLVYFLSLFAGYSLYRVQKDRGWSGPVTIAIALSLGFANYPLWQQLFMPDSDRGRFAAYDWIANHTPPNSLVMTGDPWACYATWRRTMGTPMPVSEPHVPARISKVAKWELQMGGSPTELRGVQILAVLAPGHANKGRLLWSNPNGWEVTELYADRYQALKSRRPSEGGN